jgi:hypothetical protein
MVILIAALLSLKFSTLLDLCWDRFHHHLHHGLRAAPLNGFHWCCFLLMMIRCCLFLHRFHHVHRQHGFEIFFIDFIVFTSAAAMMTSYVCTHVGDKHMWQWLQSCHWWDCNAQGACTCMPMRVPRALNNLLTSSSWLLLVPPGYPGSSWLSWLPLAILVILAPPGYPGYPHYWLPLGILAPPGYPGSSWFLLVILAPPGYPSHPGSSWLPWSS